MNENKKKIIVGVTGASGAIYAKSLINKLQTIDNQVDDCGIIFSENAKKVWEYELGNKYYHQFPYKIYAPDDFFAPFASGSAKYDAMIICPCTMGTLGRISNGISNDLLTRAADVMLKEKKKLILVTREMPFNLIHIENLKKITLAGGIICPASPSFYSKPSTIDELIDTVIDRVLDLAGFDISTFRWK
ncbi:MAG: 3-octaprenyl-4-hydroxybenzoate carboxy-lyase [Bacteroidetes bacterium CG2_30_32_10]|nr:MAG: 3-octaprenyl-4-hydroxybenzoate carboxy-lyase [Bacteroidetes bacterium CG2_30_32_10]